MCSRAEPSTWPIRNCAANIRQINVRSHRETRQPFSHDTLDSPPENSREFKEKNEGGRENFLKTKQQDSGAGGARIMFAQAKTPLTYWNGRTAAEATNLGDTAGVPRDGKFQPLEHTLMEQLKFRRQHNESYNSYRRKSNDGPCMPFNRYYQENRSLANMEVFCAETAVEGRMEKPRFRVKLATSGLQSDSWYESADDYVDTALAHCVRMMQPDAQQTFLGEQSKPIVCG